jgi:hypothetical protein
MANLNAALTKIQEQEAKLAELKAELQQADAAVTAALNGLTENNAELSDWLKNKAAEIGEAFEGSTVARVSKKEREALQKALAAISLTANPEFAFVIDNAAQIAESFRWPVQKRMSAEELVNKANEVLMDLTGGNVELTSWIIAKKDDLLAAFAAGVKKRVVSEKATAALAKYQADQKAIKAAAMGVSVEEYEIIKANEKAKK